MLLQVRAGCSLPPLQVVSSISLQCEYHSLSSCNVQLLAQSRRQNVSRLIETDVPGAARRKVELMYTIYTCEYCVLIRGS